MHAVGHDNDDDHASDNDDNRAADNDDDQASDNDDNRAADNDDDHATPASASAGGHVLAVVTDLPRPERRDDQCVPNRYRHQHERRVVPGQ